MVSREVLLKTLWVLRYLCTMSVFCRILNRACSLLTMAWKIS